MNSITKETRRESYDDILFWRTVLSRFEKIPYFNRNYVAPRLTELKDIGVLETVGRRKATRSDATEAVWARKELPHEPR